MKTRLPYASPRIRQSLRQSLRHGFKKTNNGAVACDVLVNLPLYLMKTQLLKDRRPNAESRMSLQTATKTEIRKSLRTATEPEVSAPELASLRFDWAKPSGSRRSELGLRHSGFGFLSAFGDAAVRFFTPILFLATVLSGVAKEVDFSESQRF